MVKRLSASAVAFTYNVQHDSHYQPQDGPPPPLLPLTTMRAKALDWPPVASLVAKTSGSSQTERHVAQRALAVTVQSPRPSPSTGTISITLAGGHLEPPLPPASLIIVPRVSSG